MQKQQQKSIFLSMIRLLNETNQYNRRHDYAYKLSGGRTESTKELNNDEMLGVINELLETFKTGDDGDKMRKKIICIAHQMNWQINGKADMVRINQWCTNCGPYNKPLNKHSVKELGILVSIFDKVYKHYINKI